MALTPYGGKEPPQELLTRSVREILEEILPHQPKNVATVICENILPWINTKAVANETQERAIKSFDFLRYVLASFQHYRSLLEMITMLNTLRG